MKTAGVTYKFRLTVVDNMVQDLRERRNTRHPEVKRHVLKLLSFRQAYLDQVYYQVQRDCRARVLADIKILVGTSAKIAEGRAGVAPWPHIFPEGSIVGSLVDEYQRRPIEMTVPLGLQCQYAVFVGEGAHLLLGNEFLFIDLVGIVLCV